MIRVEDTKGLRIARLTAGCCVRALACAMHRDDRVSAVRNIVEIAVMEVMGDGVAGTEVLRELVGTLDVAGASTRWGLVR